MKKSLALLFLVLLHTGMVVGCTSNVSPTTTLTSTVISPTSTVISSTSTLPEPSTTLLGRTVVVTNTADSGPGTLRQALLDVQRGDTIIFDPAVFSPANPAVIRLGSGLPAISAGYVTVDGSGAGVVLDGSQAEGDWTSPVVVHSANNTVRGLEVINFSGPGIQLTERASDNVIGPDNVIAFNGRAGEGVAGGVEIRSLQATGNRITGNSIHDNSLSGIVYSISDVDPAAFPAPPRILDYDVGLGIVSGVALPNSVVEVFSDDAGDGAVYEARATADQNGEFSISKGQSFAGPRLTATSTAPGANTSAFSIPTSAARASPALQSNNSLPRALAASRTGLSEGEGIGLLFSAIYRLDDLQSTLFKNVLQTGAQRVKLSITEIEPESNLGGAVMGIAWDVPEFSFAQKYEDFIQQLADSGIDVTYVLSFWDKANHPNGWQPAVSRFRTQQEIDRYLEYVRFIVDHFKGRVKCYEIWNEPDWSAHPLHWIQPEDYIRLVRQTIPVIRQADPTAKIVVGSVVLAPSLQEYLLTILRSDIMPAVDVVSWHPFFGDSPERNADYYYSYPSIVQQIKDMAQQHGFRGTYRADEINYTSSDAPWADSNDVSYSNVQAAKYYARGMVMNMGLGVAVGLANAGGNRQELFSVIRGLGAVMDGSTPAALRADVHTAAKYVQSYGFSASNGDRLLAVWNDGPAVDADPGVSSTLTVPGLAGWKATAIDVLNGFQQEMMCTSENGALVISGFLLKDYPVIIRLSK